ncbi:MAG: lipocalin family protein [Bacteroidota bacterium]|nr:lipocalin family protein [Bacteroidota bacterium]
MNYKTSVVILFFNFFIVASCSQNENKKLIIGNWQAVSWTSQGTPTTYDPALTSFGFDDQGAYSFQYDTNLEEGKYFVSNNQLFTTPDGGMKMMVKIVKLTSDSLVFNMNRGGTGEQITLVRNPVY